MSPADVPPTRRAARSAKTKDAAPAGTAPVTDRTPDATAAAQANASLVGRPMSAANATTAAPAAPRGLAAPAQPPRALSWVDATALAATIPAADLAAASAPYESVSADLLSGARRRSPWRPGVLIPIFLILLLVAGYSATTLLWPLYAVEPQISAIQVEPIAAPAATPAWPATGSGAVAVAGITGTLASTSDARAIASITKLVTTLMVLEQQPLAVGEQGPTYRFTASDRATYWTYRRDGESSLDVPVGGTLTQYQMLQGTLIASASNYADRLAHSLWPTDAVFANAARTFMNAHGITGITIVDPTGIKMGNTADPASLIPLAQLAMANPVVAEIVATKSVTLPGAGLIENTNGLLADAGVVGIKTGSLDADNLLAAKDITVGGTSVRLYATTLGQPNDATRVSATRALFTQLEQELALKPSVNASTVIGQATTRWGEKVDVVTTADADVVLWNGGVGTVTTTFDLGDNRSAGDTVGSLTVTGPLNTATVDAHLAADIEPPSPWWRLTHPLDLFGLSG